MHGGLWEYWRGLRSRGGERQQAGSSNMRGFMGGISPEGCVDTHRCLRPDRGGSGWAHLEEVTSPVRQKV